MFKNKHVVVAMIVAPLLSLGAYFATDFLVSEKPHKARAGESYELIAQSNCRYSSGRCDLENGNFKVSLFSEKFSDGGMRITLQSSHALEGIKVALVNDVSEADIVKPQEMSVFNGNTQHWQADIKGPISKKGRIRLVVAANSGYYFADTGIDFTFEEVNNTQLTR